VPKAKEARAKRIPVRPVTSKAAVTAKADKAAKNGA